MTISSETMLCANCGAEVKTQTSFCPACFRSLAPETTPSDVPITERPWFRPLVFALISPAVFLMMWVAFEWSFAAGAYRSSPEQAPAPEATARPAGYISRADLGSDWPFTVADGVISCEPPSCVLFTTGGKTYAINGTARTFMKENGWLDISDSPIWAKGEKGSGAPKKSIGPIIDRGLAMRP